MLVAVTEVSAVRRTAILTMAAVSFSLCGCVLADFVFAAFANAYSAGGRTNFERKQHFDRQWESACEEARREEMGRSLTVSVPNPIESPDR